MEPQSKNDLGTADSSTNAQTETAIVPTQENKRKATTDNTENETNEQTKRQKIISDTIEDSEVDISPSTLENSGVDLSHSTLEDSGVDFNPCSTLENSEVVLRPSTLEDTVIDLTSDFHNDDLDVLFIQNLPLRDVVVDACNVGYSYANFIKFDFQGVVIATSFFESRGHKVYILLPLRYRARIDKELHSTVNDMMAKGSLIFVPGRVIDDVKMNCDDDSMIVQYAHQTQSVVVSNDQYRDLMTKKPEYKETIKNRLLSYVFVGNIFMVSDLPQGNFGPSLDDFLRY